MGPFAGADDLPQWAIALIVMGSSVTLAIVLLAISKALHYYNLIQNAGEPAIKSHRVLRAVTLGP